jgi:hypothetical protein
MGEENDSHPRCATTWYSGRPRLSGMSERSHTDWWDRKCQGGMPLRCLHVVTTEYWYSVERRKISVSPRSYQSVRVPPSVIETGVVFHRSRVESDERWEMNAYTGWNLIAMNNNKYRYRWNWNWALMKAIMKGVYRIVPGRFFVNDHSNRIGSA